MGWWSAIWTKTKEQDEGPFAQLSNKAYRQFSRRRSVHRLGSLVGFAGLVTHTSSRGSTASTATTTYAHTPAGAHQQEEQSAARAPQMLARLSRQQLQISQRCMHV